jgi:2,4-dienoyl-CoA reductase-like NADH-dependent reductase (Old Yellow Enzyme family)
MADANRYRLTTTPIKLGAVEIRNRFYLSSHGVGYNVGYEPSDVFAEYYRVRAAGGCGLLVHAMSTMPKRGGGSLTTPYLERTVGEPDAPRTFTDLYFAPVDFSTFQRPASVLLAE